MSFHQRSLVLAVLLLTVLMAACRREPPAPPVPMDPAGGVVFDLASVPYPKLSDYNFFQGSLRHLSPNGGVLPYTLINTLFTDHAEKQRHVWMPAGVRAQWQGEGQVLDLPVGAVLLKSFYYDGVQPGNTRRMLETRLMYRSSLGWHFANYVWNDEQSDAVLDMQGSMTAVEWIDIDGITQHVDYRIPSAGECLTCHRADGEAIPIGPKPRNMHLPFAYADGTAWQLARWAQAGYLDPAHPGVSEPLPYWRDEQQDMERRVRAYLDINCAHCHTEGRYCDYRPMRFDWSETGTDTNLGICVTPDDAIATGLSHIVSRGRPDRSMMLYRMASTAVETRMPLLGRTVAHDEALELVTHWIESLQPDCP